MGDLLDGIGKAVGEVVHGVNDPVVTDAIVARALDPVDDGVTHGDIGRCHVDLRTEHTTAVFELTGPHPGEDVEVLLDGPVAVGTVPAWLRERAPVSPDLVGVEVADVCLPPPDEGHGELVEGLEVVRGEEEPVFPIKAKPPDVILDGLHELQGFPGGVGIIHAEVARSPVLGGDPEVQAYRLGVSYMEVAVRLRRKTRGDRVVLAGLEVVVDDLSDEIAWRGKILFCHVRLSSVCVLPVLDRVPVRTCPM
ncbi:MAG: hypothetical protein A4E61_00223 [Syntrophorhabdus sp. PtaB.Bin184]|nr:MAG: hypothetical protein A4E61_00223 [Syntrophorhabdus sp. PtaB.Bin184]